MSLYVFEIPFRRELPILQEEEALRMVEYLVWSYCPGPGIFIPTEGEVSGLLGTILHLTPSFPTIFCIS